MLIEVTHFNLKLFSFQEKKSVSGIVLYFCQLFKYLS